MTKTTTTRKTVTWAMMALALGLGWQLSGGPPADLGLLVGAGLLDGITLATLIGCGVCLGSGAGILLSGTTAILAFISASVSIAKAGACIGVCAAVVGL